MSSIEKSTILVDGIYKRNKITDRGIHDLFKYIMDYVDRHSDILSSSYLDMMYFSEEDKKIAYNTLGVDKYDIIDVISTIDDIKGFIVVTEPFSMAITMIIRYMIIKKYSEREIGLVAFYFGIMYYPSVFTRQFPHGINTNTMRYTIDNLNEKYDIKKDDVKTIHKMFTKKGLTCVNTYKDKLIHGTDFEITNFISQMSGRVKDTIKNISRDYYKNNEEGKFTNLDNESLEEDNYHETDSNSLEAQRCIDKARLKISEEGTDPNIFKIIKKLETEVSEKELHNAVITINRDHYSDVSRLIFLIVDLFMQDNDPRVIRDSEFIFKCMSIYSRSNTTDEIVLEIKTILDKLLLNTSKTYRKTNRVSTINSYKKSLYYYYVILISKSSKN